MNKKLLTLMVISSLSILISGCNTKQNNTDSKSGDSNPASTVKDAATPASSPTASLLIESYGDSTTLGETLKDGELTLVDRPAPAIIQEALTSEFAGKVAISNEGVSGSQAIQLLNGSDGKHKPWAEQMKNSKAQIVTLNFGLNEAFYLKNPVPQFEPMPPEKFADVLRSLVQTAQENGKAVVLIEPSPTCDKERADGVQFYAMRVDELGKELQIPVVGTFWEIGKKPDWKGSLTDCVHPNQDLYKTIAELQYGTLRPLILEKLK